MTKKSILSLSLFFAFLLFIFMMWRKQQGGARELFKRTLKGEVIMYQKSNKGIWHVTILENRRLRYIGYTPESEELMARNGDSIYKETSSDVYYIKKKGRTSFVPADWKYVHINKKWE